MIGKAKSIAHLTASLEYVTIEEKKSKEIGRKHLIGDATGIKLEMEAVQKMNYRCKNNTIRIELSPDPRDISKLDTRAWRNLTYDFVSMLSEKVNDDLQEHQWVAYKHDKAGPKNHIDRPHLHLYINRIGFDGKATNDKFIGKKAQLVAHELAKKYQLISARDLMDQKVKKSSPKDLKSMLINTAKRSSSLEDFIAKSKASDIEILTHTNKAGEVVGLKVHYANQEYKISDIHRSLTIKRIDKLFKGHEQKRGLSL